MNHKYLLLGFFLVLFSINAFAVDSNIDTFEDGNGLNAPFYWTSFTNTPTLTTVNAATMIGNYFFQSAATGVAVAYTRSTRIYDLNNQDNNYEVMIRCSQVAGTCGISLGDESTTTTANSLISFTMRTSKFQYLFSNGTDVDLCASPTPSTNTNYWFLITYKNNTSTAYYQVRNDTNTILCDGNQSVKTAGYVSRMIIYSNNSNTVGIDNIRYFPTANIISADFNYSINRSTATINLLDNSTDLNGTINDWNWLKDGLSFATTQNTSFVATELTDYNICLIAKDNYLHSGSKCSNINSGRFYGIGKISLFNSANNPLTGASYAVIPSINGISSGTLTDNNLDFNVRGTTGQVYSFSFTKANYTTLSFDLNLSQYTDADYNFVMIDTTLTSNVNFQVFNMAGAYASGTKFFAYDYGLNKYVGIQTTDSLGRMTFNLDQTQSDYNFFSSDFNFGTTIWTINKPKDATTLTTIAGNWNYSITGASYSSGANIAGGVQKLLLQNTVTAYSIKIVDTNGSYVQTTFGLKSVTSETTKSLTPYLYPTSRATLKIIKLIDFATNQPHSGVEELNLYVYTDSNGLIPIGVFTNDSTGTYNIYMDSNASYSLTVLSNTYTLNPVLDVYYLYLTEGIGIIMDNNLLTPIVAPVLDGNFPLIFVQLREVAFGCSQTNDNCYPSMIFSIIAIVVLLIVMAIAGLMNPITQSFSLGLFLTIFLAIGFIPLWLYAIGIVILIAWSVFKS